MSVHEPEECLLQSIPSGRWDHVFCHFELWEQSVFPEECGPIGFPGVVLRGGSDEVVGVPSEGWSGLAVQCGQLMSQTDRRIRVEWLQVEVFEDENTAILRLNDGEGMGAPDGVGVRHAEEAEVLGSQHGCFGSGSLFDENGGSILI